MHPVVLQTGWLHRTKNTHWDSLWINTHHTRMLIFQGFLFFFLFFLFVCLFCFCIFWVSRGYQTWVLALKIIQKWWDWYLVMWGKASWSKSTLVAQWPKIHPSQILNECHTWSKKKKTHLSCSTQESDVTHHYFFCLPLPPATPMCHSGIGKPGQCLLFCFG